MLALIEVLAREIPCYDMEFDQSGAIVAELQDLVRTARAPWIRPWSDERG